MGCGFIEFGCPAAVAADRKIAETDVDAVGIDLGTGVADGGNKTAPVGIGAGPRGLDQRRMRDGFGDPEGIGIGLRAINLQLDNVGDAFAVGNDLPGERGANIIQRSGKSGVVGGEGDAARAGSHEQHSVVGRGVAIDRDAIEAGLNSVAEKTVENCGFDRRIGQ